MKVWIILRQGWDYDSSDEVCDVAASEELAEAWAEHYRRENKDPGVDFTVYAWDVEEKLPVVAP